ncbi:hypothetical protein DBK23_07040, partial [Salmonella enterica subsp. enterica serovar Typhi]|uniref:hypothetical protein n=1 Tax=Salmonella enterica TaxID=28901 RepID=UPI000DE6BA43
ANVRSYAPVRARLVREPYRRIRKPPAMPEDIYYFNGLLFLNFETIKKSSTDLTGIFLFFYQRKIKRFR